MHSLNLFHESLTDALKDCCMAAGGTKQVAAQLWPEKTPDAAHRLLLSCLNDDRPEKLSPDQLLLVFRLAKAKGCHIGVAYMLRELGYADPVPVEPRDEAAELQRQYIEAAKSMARIADRIERLSPVLRAA